MYACVCAWQGVRTRAADCLGKIMAFSPRVDPIVNDLCKGVEAATTTGIQDSMVEALLVNTFRGVHYMYGSWGN